ncbi:MAG: ornithine cyclodeaminase family protein [Bacteroidota bacterium]
MENNIPYWNAEAILKKLPYENFVPYLERFLQQPAQVPERPHYTTHAGPPSHDLLLMPAWDQEQLGVKMVTVHPDNPIQGLPAIQGLYVLFSARTGSPLAIMDAASLTARRTAAASVVAARFLARSDAKRLLILGTGRLSTELAQAYQTFFPLESIQIWGRNYDKAQRKTQILQEMGINALPIRDLEAAVPQADIISSATSSFQPIVHGEWLQTGQHIDLIGSYRKDQREADDEVIRRCEVYLDTWQGLEESGDLYQPLETGILHKEDIRATLLDLCRRKHAGRHSNAEITLFKSVGFAQEDLAAARFLLL